MAFKKSIFKIMNSAGEWVEHYFKTSADQVVFTKQDGSSSDVQKELTEQNSALGKWEAHYVVLSYISATRMEGYIYCSGPVDVAVATVRAIDGTPFQNIARVFLRPNAFGAAERINIYVEGTGFIAGHVLGIDILAKLK